MGQEPSLNFVSTAFCQNQKNQNKVPAVARRPCQGSGVAWRAWGTRRNMSLVAGLGQRFPAGSHASYLSAVTSLTPHSRPTELPSVIRTPFYTRRKPGLERSRHWPKVTVIVREEARTQPWSFILKIVALMPLTPS